MNCLGMFALITLTLSFPAQSSTVTIPCLESPCSGECGPLRTPHLTTKEESVMCYCDLLCPHFGDCCPSYEDNGCSEQEDPELMRKSEFMTCGAKIEAVMKMPAIYFVNKCPVASREEWRHLCEDENSSIRDSLVLHVPAFETRTRIVHRNMYCLQCHGIGLRESEYWFNLYQSEHFLQPLTEFTNMTIHLQLANFLLRFGYHVVLDTLYGKGLAVTRHDQLFYRRCMEVYRMLQCYTGQDPESRGASLGENVSYRNYDFCPAGVENELANNCALYDNPVTSGPRNDVTWFKNAYCAQCQNYTVNNCSRVVDDVKSLSCRPIWTGPPWGLNRLFLPPMPCAQGEYKDPIDGSCRRQAACRPGKVYWQDECILDPYSDVYTSPRELDSRSGIQWILVLTLRANFYILGEDKSSLENETIHTFADILRNQMDLVLTRRRLNSTLIRLLKDPQSLSPVLGGWQYFMPENSKLELLFHNGKEITRIDELLVLLMYYELIEKEMYDKLQHDSYKRLRILTRNVEHPIRCERGDMVNVSMEIQIGETDIKITDKMLLYMRHAADADMFGRVLVDYNMNTSSITVYLCDTTPVVMKICPLLNYTMENFTLHAGNLLHTPTGHIFTEGSFLVDRNDVFVCVTNFEVDTILFHVNVAGFVISDVFFLYSIVTHLILPELRTLPGLMIMNLCGNLFVSQVLFLIGVVLDGVAMSCLVIAAMLHYAWLSTFLWMNSIAFSTWLTFRQKIVTTSKSRKSLVLYSLYSYVVPALVVGVCLTLHFTGQVSIYAAGLNGNTSPGICWIYNENVRNYAFMLPLAVVVLANILLFSSTAYNIRNIQKDVKFATTSPLDVVLYFKMSFLLGFSWLFGILGALIPNPVFEYLFIVLSSATGILVGASFTCTERVFKMYKRRFRPGWSCDSRRSATSKTGTVSATVNSTSVPQK